MFLYLHVFDTQDECMYYIGVRHHSIFGQMDKFIQVHAWFRLPYKIDKILKMTKWKYPELFI